jgi:DGQHR domain-containing protein
MQTTKKPSKKSKKSKKTGTDLPKFQVVIGTCLGYKAYRGFAPLSDLAAISKADVFDQKDNPLGTQRNLNRQHARKAYQYVTTVEKAFYPEIILNVRDSSYISISSRRINGQDYGTVRFTKDPKKSTSIIVSRLDGNHRLWFSDGHEEGMDAISRSVSFCILNLKDLSEELDLFRAINDNQMGMNTSHLQNITARLLGEKVLKLKDPALYIVQNLQKDTTSPFYQRIHEGGVVKRGATLPGLTTANLKNAVQDMLSRSAKLSQFPDTDAQYQIIKNFWLAVKNWMPDAWEHPTEYIIFKGVGLYAISYLGIEIIDRCLLKGKYSPDCMQSYLEMLPQTNAFTAKGGIPYAGRAGGRKIASDLVADLEEEGEVSLSKLQKMILGDE